MIRRISTVSFENTNASKATSILGKPGLLPLLWHHLSIFFCIRNNAFSHLEQQFHALMIAGAVPRISAPQVLRGE